MVLLFVVYPRDLQSPANLTILKKGLLGKSDILEPVFTCPYTIKDLCLYTTLVVSFLSGTVVSEVGYPYPTREKSCHR